jgi:hypothetical protein
MFGGRGTRTGLLGGRGLQGEPATASGSLDAADVAQAAPQPAAHGPAGTELTSEVVPFVVVGAPGAVLLGELRIGEAVIADATEHGDHLILSGLRDLGAANRSQTL